MAKAEPIFSDLDFNFKRNPLTGDITRKIDEEAVKQSMKNLILTNFYERPFQSSVGSPVRGILFEQMTPMMGVLLKKSIEQVLQNFEPRIVLQGVDVSLENDLNENDVQITIYYYIDGTVALKTFDLTLERTR